jgi:tetratricopeptide (TPR) repeat protein
MSRIKLPGKEKNKKILLIILVIISIGIIIYNTLGNISSRNIENKDQEEIVKPTNIEESNTNNTANNDTDENNDDSSKVDNSGKNKVSQENNYSTKENDIYNEAYKLFFSHDYVKAISKADSLISEFPNNAMGYNIRGIAKAYNGDYDGGMSDIDKALGIDNDYGYARFNKALTYELYGKMDKALEWYNKNLEVENYVWSYYGIASIYGRRGDVKNTMDYLNKAIQIDEGVKDVAKTEHDFDPVKNSEEFQKAVYS